MNYQRLYEFRFRDIDQGAREAVWVEIAAYVYELLGRPERVLDPAAGRGEFINHVPAKDRCAVDIVEHADGTYQQGVTRIVADIFDASLPIQYFDAVWVSNFCEHLLSQEQCAEFLDRMYATLRPGGRVAVMGPNFRYCMAEYFDFADHTLIFTHLGMAEHVVAAGFDLERVLPRFLPYSFRSRLPASPTLTRHYLHLPLLWRIFGKQFLILGRRPESPVIRDAEQRSA